MVDVQLQLHVWKREEGGGVEEEDWKKRHNVKAMSRQFDVNIDFAVVIVLLSTSVIAWTWATILIEVGQLE